MIQFNIKSLKTNKLFSTLRPYCCDLIRKQTDCRLYLDLIDGTILITVNKVSLCYYIHKNNWKNEKRGKCQPYSIMEVLIYFCIFSQASSLKTKGCPNINNWKVCPALFIITSTHIVFRYLKKSDITIDADERFMIMISLR